MAIPECYFGSFQHERSENFDEYLSANGVNWMLRKMISKANITKTISANGDGTYSVVNKAPFKTMQWTFKLNEPFEDVGMDKKKQRITFDVDGEILVEKHVRLEDNNKEEIVRYTREGDYLVATITNGEITCKRFFKKL